MTDQPLQIAALMCSRLCHDLISPVGAIANGIEVMRDEDDKEMREHAMTLIEASVAQAAARLQYARLAFGTAGSAGSEIDTTEARKLVSDLMTRGKAELDWQITAPTAPKDEVRLLLNMILIGIDCIPRGGVLAVGGSLGGSDGLFVTATGPRARLGHEIREALGGEVALSALDSRQIQPAFAGYLATSMATALSVDESEERVVLRASPRTL